MERHPSWVLVEKYIDRGITGTSAKKRPSFMRMIKDAESENFDLIITREVSRFARNTVDTLSYTRQLKKWDVEVYFVEDNIWTYDPDGELRLTIMATLAQDESRKTSLRVKAGQRASMEKGVFFQNGSILGYDYDKVNRTLTINEEQAETVKLIFDLYNSGMGVRKIQWELEQRGRKTATGSTLWSASVICRALKNKLYAGYIVWHKQYVPDFLEQKKINNHGEIEQFEVQGNHEPIVTLEEWEMAQARLDSKRVDNKGQKTVRENADVWGKKLICSCGSKFQRRMYHKNKETGEVKFSYVCYNVIKSGSIKTRQNKGLPIEGMCATPSVTRWKLEAMAYYIFKSLTLHKDTIIVKAEKMLKTYLDSVDSGSDAEQAEILRKEIDKYNKKIDNLIDLYTDGGISREKFAEKKGEFEKVIEGYESQYERLSATDSRITDYSTRLDLFKKALDRIEKLDESKKVPEYLIDAMVEYILVDGNTFKWKFRMLPDSFDLTCKGKRENSIQIERADNSYHVVCSEQHRQPFAMKMIEKPLKIAEFCMDKELTRECLNLNPANRINLYWRDMFVELFI